MAETRTASTRKSRSKKILIIVIASVAAVFLLLITIRIRFSTPGLKKRAIEALSENLNGDVQLQEFDVSFFPIRAHGSGLTVRWEGRTDVEPLVSVAEFSATSTVWGLIGKPWTVDQVILKGLVVHVPPRDSGPPNGYLRGKKRRKMDILVHELVADNARVQIHPKSPDKAPLTFQIQHVALHNAGFRKPASFTAQLINAKPPGEIDSNGTLGPWNAEVPAQTPLAASYTFTKADLGVFKGISGTLSSQGKYQGVLDHIDVQGETDTPDFTVRTGNHAVDLHTTFSATVDAMNGNTFLHPVHAEFLNSSLTANGEVVQAPDKKGHIIVLDVAVDKGRIEDMLRLGVKSDKPLMTGPLRLHTKFELPNGEGDVIQRLKLDGGFDISKSEFTSSKIASKVQTLSKKGEGKPEEADAGSSVSSLAGHFALANSTISFRGLKFEVPGAAVQLDGTYGLENEAINFHGTLTMKAKLSQTTSGYKSVLLRPFDPLFRKNYRTVIPIRIAGTRTKPSFALDLAHRVGDAKNPAK